jgi:hypothetical protein
MGETYREATDRLLQGEDIQSVDRDLAAKSDTGGDSAAGE